MQKDKSGIARSIFKVAAFVIVYSASCLSAQADHYDAVLAIDFDPAKKEVLIVISMVYQDVNIGRNEMYFDDLVKKKRGLTYKLSAKHHLQILAFSNPQARRNDNVQILLDSKPIASLDYNLNGINLVESNKTVLDQVKIKETAAGKIDISDNGRSFQ